VGPGFFIDRRDGPVVIVATVPGSPAALAGVQAGDRLRGVDSVVADPTRLDRLATLLEGKAGSTVELRLRRTGARSPFTLEVVRGPVPELRAVESTLFGGGVARIRIAHFVGARG
jgi:carboxyl-terminal processing protease